MAWGCCSRLEQSAPYPMPARFVSPLCMFLTLRSFVWLSPFFYYVSYHVRKFNHSVVPTCHLLQTAQPQQTISKPVTREGIGLHSGERATLRLLPAGAGEGRYFVQLPKEANKEAVIVPATVKNVIDTRLSTCLGKNRASVYTVEHLMSALEGLGVDNCRIEIDGGSEVIIIITIIMYMHASFRSGNFLIPVAAAMILEVTEQCGRMIFERIRCVLLPPAHRTWPTLNCCVLPGNIVIPGRKVTHKVSRS